MRRRSWVIVPSALIYLATSGCQTASGPVTEPTSSPPDSDSIVTEPVSPTGNQDSSAEEFVSACDLLLDQGYAYGPADETPETFIFEKAGTVTLSFPDQEETGVQTSYEYYVFDDIPPASVSFKENGLRITGEAGQGVGFTFEEDFFSLLCVVQKEAG